MTSAPISRLLVRDASDQIVGYTDNLASCGHPDCLAAIAAGRCWHATPYGFATTLPSYHFASADEAIRALLDAATAHPEGIARRNEISARIQARKAL